MAKDGIHALLLVVSLKVRFNEEQVSIVETLTHLFEDRILDYMIVAFTGGDELEDDRTLDEYLACSTPAALKNETAIMDYKNSINEMDKALEDEELQGASAEMNHREAHGLEPVEDKWSTANKEQAEKYSKDTEKIESFKTVFSHGDVKDYSLPLQFEAENGRNWREDRSLLSQEVILGTKGTAVTFFDPPIVDCAELEQKALAMSTSECLMQVNAIMINFLSQIRDLNTEVKKLRDEKKSSEDYHQTQQLLNTREKEIEQLKKDYNAIDEELKVSINSHIAKDDLYTWLVTFLYRIMSSKGMVEKVKTVNLSSFNYGCHFLAVAVLESLAKGIIKVALPTMKEPEELTKLVGDVSVDLTSFPPHELSISEVSDKKEATPQVEEEDEEEVEEKGDI
ncbi:OLC1v1015918C2 [Oldenlandia corymbosa var. corymbosa]|nr:OLC1v1015918C2 [Oldenlandia corymbosa var. corymbosa]